MKVIIDIPKEEYKHVMMLGTIGNVTAVSNAIFNGTPLTKERCKSKNFDIIWYHGYDFDVRFVKASIFPHSEDAFGKRMIATKEFLYDYLLNTSGDFADEEAIELDEQIFYYVPERILKTYSDEEFDKYVVEIFG